MAYQNPKYNPDWEVVHDHHAPKREQAMATMRPLEAEGGTDSSVYRHAATAHSAHNDACIAAILSQFETVQDYARWLSERWQLPYGYDPSIPIPHLDIEAFSTMKDASAGFSKTSQEIQDAINIKRHSLPVAQPEGLTAFSDPASPGLTRTWRTFSSAELYPEGYGERGTALIVADERDDGLHVCLGQDLNFPGATASHFYPVFAAAFYREVNALHAPPASKRLAAWFRRWRGKGAPVGFPVERLHFYLHVMPTSGLRECFDGVIMRFEGGEFHEESWVTYKSIPAVIQSARDYLDNLDGSGRPARQRRMIDGPGHKSVET